MTLRTAAALAPSSARSLLHRQVVDGFISRAAAIIVSERVTMHPFKRSFFPIIVLASLVSPAAAADPTGEWLVADGTARISIEPCADALWGVIAWTKDPAGTDENNPDPAKRSRSIIGLPILLNMKRVEANRWDGQVYNAENGNTYTSRISLVKDDVLRIEGCVFGGLFCGGENWTRFSSAKNRPEPAAKQKDVCP